MLIGDFWMNGREEPSGTLQSYSEWAGLGPPASCGISEATGAAEGMRQTSSEMGAMVTTFTETRSSFFAKEQHRRLQLEFDLVFASQHDFLMQPPISSVKYLVVKWCCKHLDQTLKLCGYKYNINKFSGFQLLTEKSLQGLVFRKHFFTFNISYIPKLLYLFSSSFILHTVKFSH